MSPGGWHSQGGIGYVGSADQGAAEAGQGPSRGGRAATGRRATRLGPGAGDVHAGPNGPGPGLHPGRVRKRGESACARAGPAPRGRTASHAGDDGRHTRRPARVHRPDRRRRVDGLAEPGMLTATAAASVGWTESVAKRITSSSGRRAAREGRTGRSPLVATGWPIAAFVLSRGCPLPFWRRPGRRAPGLARRPDGPGGGPVLAHLLCRPWLRRGNGVSPWRIARVGLAAAVL